MDQTNGYEEIATEFIQSRGQALNGIGVSSVKEWAETLPTGSTVLDLGCGNGIPISKTLMDEGLAVYAVDASPTMVESFKMNFPNVPIICEAVEDSSFYSRKFDGVVSWGLMFLLSEEIQVLLIQKVANALKEGGKFLFTAPAKPVTWKDVMTGQNSRSLGTEKYKALLSLSGMQLINEFEDSGENHYYSAVKVGN